MTLVHHRAGGRAYAGEVLDGEVLPSKSATTAMVIPPETSGVINLALEVMVLKYDGLGAYKRGAKGIWNIQRQTVRRATWGELVRAYCEHTGGELLLEADDRRRIVLAPKDRLEPSWTPVEIPRPRLLLLIKRRPQVVAVRAIAI